MSMPMKCPNPNCSFVFDATLVPPGILIGCPQCHMQFTMPALAPGYGPAPTSGATAPPVEDELLNFGTHTGATKPKKKNTTEEGRRATSEKRKNGEKPDVSEGEEPPKKSLVPLLIGVGAVFGTIIFAVAMFFVVRSLVNSRGVRGVSGDISFQGYHIVFSPPKDLADWSRDESDGSGSTLLGANLMGFKKVDTGSVRMAFHARSNFGYNPQEQELHLITVEMLRKAFDEIPDALSTHDDTWLGMRAKLYQFSGVYKPTGETIAGEVHVVATKGIAYWSFAWGPRSTVLAYEPEFAALRNSWKFLNTASSLAEPKPIARDYRAKGPAYKFFVVTDHEDIWTMPPEVDPARRDDKGVLYMREKNKTGDPTRRPEAEFFVAVLEGGDPKKIAEDHIKSQLPMGTTPPNFTTLTGDPTGEPTKVSGVKGHSETTRWEVRYPDADRSVNKLVVYTAMGVDGKVVVAYSVCELGKKNRWEQHMMLLVGSLRAPK